MENIPPVTTAAPSAAEDKTVAIISYITIIGFIIAIVMHGSNKTKLGAFHLRQVLGFIISSFAIGIGAMIVVFVLAFIPVVGPIIAMLTWGAMGLTFFVMWLLGLIAAVNGQQKPIPVIGDYYQKWFSGVFQ